jgi:uncharacterized coiled-coil protein SlyX
MFDDSKRLDGLEAQMAEVRKWISGTTDVVNKTNERITKLNEYVDRWFTQNNENFKVLGKRIDDAETATKENDAAIKKLQQRCANLEADVKKLKK